jgi:hypothetical protein
LTAGKGKIGDGDVERRSDGEELNELLRLAASIGGFMGLENEVGVPGVDGAGEAITAALSREKLLLRDGKSGGAGLLDDTLLRGGRSIRESFPCCERENWPSFDLRV